MIGGDHQDCVQILLLEELAVVLVDAPLGLLGLGGLLGPLDEAVGGGGDLGRFGQLVDEEPGPAAHADHAHRDPLARPRSIRRRQHARRYQLRQANASGRCAGGAGQETASRKTLHVCHG